jgi:hypothetical protein
VVSSDLQNPSPNVTAVTASWIVPTVTPSLSDTFSSEWIGIGGQFDRTLIQCGVEQDSVGGQLQYGAWYELLPRNSVPIRMFVVSPGDVIQASIQLSNAALNRWTINLTDNTSGQSFQNTFTYSSSQLSAEWIIERPTVNNVISSLANFGSVTFSGCTATLNATIGGIGSFPSNEVVMYSSTSASSGVPLTDVSTLSGDGSGFTVSYLPTG